MNKTYQPHRSLYHNQNNIHNKHIVKISLHFSGNLFTVYWYELSLFLFLFIRLKADFQYYLILYYMQHEMYTHIYCSRLACGAHTPGQSDLNDLQHQVHYSDHDQIFFYIYEG